MKRKTLRPTQAVPLGKARRLLSPLVQELAATSRSTVPISVRGEIRAYLVSARRLEQLEALERGEPRGKPATIKGTVKILGELGQASRAAADDLDRAAVESWDRAMRGPRS